MTQADAIAAFIDKQKKLLVSTYDDAWQRGVDGYGQGAPPDKPDAVRRAVALAPAFKSLNSMADEMAALKPSKLREAYNPDQPRAENGEWGDGGSDQSPSQGEGFDAWRARLWDGLKNGGSYDGPKIERTGKLYRAVSDGEMEAARAKGEFLPPGDSKDLFVSDDPDRLAGGAYGGAGGGHIIEIDPAQVTTHAASTVFGAPEIAVDRIPMSAITNRWHWDGAAKDHLREAAGSSPNQYQPPTVGDRLKKLFGIGVGITAAQQAAKAAQAAQNAAPAPTQAPEPDNTAVGDVTADAGAGSGAAEDLGSSLADWLIANAWRLDAAASVVWAGEQAGYGEAADSDGQLLEWDDTGDENECDDCHGLADMPPQPLSDWPCTPGDGATECNVGCRCSLSAVDGMSVLPGDTYSPDLNDDQQALMDKLSQAQADAMSSMMPDAQYLD